MEEKEEEEEKKNSGSMTLPPPKKNLVTLAAWYSGKVSACLRGHWRIVRSNPAWV
jgi:hypothetical protein